MKQLTYFLLAFAFVFINLNILSGQRSSKSLQFGIGGEGTLSLTSTAPARVGTGLGLHLWLAYPLSKHDVLQLTTGYRDLMGYRQKAITFTESIYPTVYQQSVHSRQLAGLAYWDAGLNWQHQIRKSPWGFGFGGRLCKMAAVKGQESNYSWVVEREFRISETFVGGGGSSYGITETKKLDKQHITSYDFGLQLQLFYQFSPGLRIQAGYYQGLKNVFGDEFFLEDERHFISSFSLGFSARLL